MNIGDAVPDFTAETTDGTFTLSEHRGRKVVLYFYPRDSTPGCTTEACGFRDLQGNFEQAGALIYGVSKDSLGSHGKFIAKQSLNFPLISDPDKNLHAIFGAWVEKTMYGRTSMGTERCTFLIDGDGKLVQVWRKVRVKGHVDAVLEATRSL